jgi:hypothetical protein
VLIAFQPPRFFLYPEAVEAEYNRMADIRDLLRSEEIFTEVKFSSNPDKAKSLDIGSLVARACECIISLQERCQEHNLVLDFASIDQRRRDSLPETHPYRVLVSYLDDAGVEEFADFGGVGPSGGVTSMAGQEDDDTKYYDSDSGSSDESWDETGPSSQCQLAPGSNLQDVFQDNG